MLYFQKTENAFWTNPYHDAHLKNKFNYLFRIMVSHINNDKIGEMFITENNVEKAICLTKMMNCEWQIIMTASSRCLKGIVIFYLIVKA